MNDEAALRDKLRKIEALFCGAGTAGEKAAAVLRRTTSEHGCGNRRSARTRSKSSSACPIRGRRKGGAA